MADRVRMTLDLPARLAVDLDRMAAERDSSKADIVRMAIEHLVMASDAKRDGYFVGAWSEADGVRREREFIGI